MVSECPVCSHPIVTPGSPQYCDYCASFLLEIPQGEACFEESDKRSASVSEFIRS